MNTADRILRLCLRMNNLTIFQFFHWYYSPEGDLWKQAVTEAQKLTDMGITHLWLPPAYKSAKGRDEPGYAVYDLYDLGEFDQKGTVRTRYGTKDEYLNVIKTCHNSGMKIIADIVLNHKLGADEKEEVPVKMVRSENRPEIVSDRQTVQANTKFTFPGRKGKYSEYIWDWRSFTGVCEDEKTINLILNEYGNGTWENELDGENGNFDYLMGCDIEFRNPYVREELKRWAKWYVETTGVDGFRLDAIKHITANFFPEWLGYLEKTFNRDFLTIGEYWKNDVNTLLSYIENTGQNILLFDVPLHFNFHEASQKGAEYDLRKIFDNTLIQKKPDSAVSFVDNHDTQPLQSLESTVDYWFKPLAYAFILLRQQGLPCIFYPVIYEAKYWGKRGDEDVFIEMNKVEGVEIMARIRKSLVYGEQRDYFDDPHVIGWTCEGQQENNTGGCAVLLSNQGEGQKWMSMGERNAGKIYIDKMGKRGEKVVLNEKGEGTFFTNAGSVSVWTLENSMP